MGAIDNFLKRRGFARLDRYGLVLTAEGRVLSTRPAVLDDGFGGRIVGWLEGDLAAMELEHASGPAAAKRATAKPVAAINRVQPAPLAARVIAPAAPIPTPVARPVIAAVVAPPPAAPRPLPGVAPAIQAVAPVVQAVAPPPVVAAEPEPEEDWEWEIAVARARAAAEEVEEARVDLLGASAVIASAMIQRKTKPGIAAIKPLAEDWDETREERVQAKPVAAKSLREPAADVPKRSTIIPVPMLPVAADPSTVRPAPRVALQPRGRMARGTGSPRFEDTVQTKAVPASNDQTSPYVMLPPEVKPTGTAHAHTKRVAAKQR